jgi:hypothetical protein
LERVAMPADMFGALQLSHHFLADLRLFALQGFHLLLQHGDVKPVETAQRIADSRTTKLYDRRVQKVLLEDIWKGVDRLLTDTMPGLGYGSGLHLTVIMATIVGTYVTIM